MELAVEPFVSQEVGDLVDSLGDDQTGTFAALGDEVPQRAADRTRQTDDLPPFGDDRELTVDLTNPVRVSRSDPLLRRAEPPT